MRNVRLYTKNGSIILIILFGFALILADCEFIAKLKKKMASLLAATPCYYPSAFPPNRDIFFFQIWSWWRCRQMKAKPHSVSGAAECEYVNCSTYVNLLKFVRLFSSDFFDISTL